MNLALVFAIVFFAGFFWLTIIKAMHMFQLNSYKPATHGRWLRQNLSSLLPGLVGLVLAAVSLLLQDLYGWILLELVYLTLLLLQRPKKAKKPLVYTMRVKRMLITLGVLFLLGVGAAVLFLDGGWQRLAIATIGAVSPLLVLVANFINKPVEAAVNQYYINDAKKLLKSHTGLTTIGVTGSYGKTSVKYILHTLLQAEFDTLKTPESYNTPMGVVKTVRSDLRATHEVFVCEMGARHVGDIKELCEIAEPKLGIITSVGPQHLETFFSIDNVKKTKFELADALPADGTIFLNMEDANIREHSKTVTKRIVGYGLSDAWDYYATDISASTKGTSFTVHTPKGECETFTTHLVGAHNVINIVGAIAVCCELGISLEKLKLQVRKLEAVPHRLQLLRRGGITIIDDAYNANPTGANAAIDALSLFDGYRILVTPGMVELGAKQDELNRAFGAYAVKACEYVILVGRKQTASIYEGLISAGYPEERIYVAEDLQDAIARAYAVDSQGKEKIILLENDLPDNF